MGVTRDALWETSETIIVLVLIAFNFILERSRHSLTLPRSRIRDPATWSVWCLHYCRAHATPVYLSCLMPSKLACSGCSCLLGVFDAFITRVIPLLMFTWRVWCLHISGAHATPVYLACLMPSKLACSGCSCLLGVFDAFVTRVIPLLMFTWRVWCLHISGAHATPVYLACL